MGIRAGAEPSPPCPFLRRGAAFLGLFLLSSEVHAQGLPLSVEDMTRQCAVIGVATVSTSSVSRDPNNGMINTTYLLEFTDLWKGEVSGPLPLVQPGGQLGNLVARVVEGQVTLRSGESIVVFATERTLGGFHVIGLRQGLYRVTSGSPPGVIRDSEPSPKPGARVSKTLQELKNEVSRALGKPPERSGEKASRLPETPASPPPSSVPPRGGPEGGPEAPSPSPQGAPPESRPWIGIVGAAVLIFAIVWIVRRGIVRV